MPDYYQAIILVRIHYTLNPSFAEKLTSCLSSRCNTAERHKHILGSIIALSWDVLQVTLATRSFLFPFSRSSWMKKEVCQTQIITKKTTLLSYSLRVEVFKKYIEMFQINYQLTIISKTQKTSKFAGHCYTWNCWTNKKKGHGSSFQKIMRWKYLLNKAK